MEIKLLKNIRTPRGDLFNKKTSVIIADVGSPEPSKGHLLIHKKGGRYMESKCVYLTDGELLSLMEKKLIQHFDVLAEGM